MLVIPIRDDEGNERNFACTALSFEDEFVAIVSCGVTYRFRTAGIMGIVPVDGSEARGDLRRASCGP